MDFSQGLQALKFGATWCGPCKMIAHKLEKLAEEFPNIKLTNIDVDDEPELIDKFKITSVPTVILLKDGQEVNRLVGAALITPLRKAFRDLSGESNDQATE